MPRKILVTSALPYANGSIHLGHLVEYIQTDIWVRFQKMQGHTVHYVCADDTHGTPIMLRAESEGITPEVLIERVHAEHSADFAEFLVEFDNYYSTNSDENREFANGIYKALKANGKIAVKTIEQFYDPVKQMFLPDRFIKGECPKCHAKDQYGDSCEVCGATYNPTELINAYSAVSGAAPVRKETEHYFFKLSECGDFLKEWTRSGTLQLEAANKMGEWFEAGLSDWDISRDAPYFGFEIPDAPGKYFYVWLDAPIGYMASFKNYCDQPSAVSGQPKPKFDEYWQREGNEGAHPKTELYHFIGKDILYFHALFWPAVLENAGYRTPTSIFVHGFLTVNGEKMSKSRGTFITARSYLEHVKNPEYLRYYYAAKLNGSMEDIDLNLEDFVARVNSDLVGKYVNIASRCASFLTKYFDGCLLESVLPTIDPQPYLNAAANEELQRRVEEARHQGNLGIIAHGEGTTTVNPKNDISEIFGWYRNQIDHISDAFERRDMAHALRLVMRLTDLANRYVDDKKPWVLAKTGELENLREVCSVAVNLFRLLTICLKPVLPRIAADVEVFLNVMPLTWDDASKILPVGHKINEYKHLMTRIDPKEIEAMTEANKENLQSTPSPQPSPKTGEGVKSMASAASSTPPSPLMGEGGGEGENYISIDDFTKVDLRIAKIVNA